MSLGLAYIGRGEGGTNIRNFIMLLAALTAGCTPPEPIRVREKAVIVSVYDEVRWGVTDGTTVVEMPDGDRIRLVGKLGTVGETIQVKVRTKKEIDEASLYKE